MEKFLVHEDFMFFFSFPLYHTRIFQIEFSLKNFQFYKLMNH